MEALKQLYKELTAKYPDECIPLPQSASSRKYFRLKKGAHSVIGTFSPDARETVAFKSFSIAFRKLGIHVPEFYLDSKDHHYYLQEDLGCEMLFDRLKASGFDLNDNPDNLKLYRKAIHQLVRIQFEGHQHVDYSLCVQRNRFDRTAILWDLNHFKYFFLKISGIPFDEDLLEKDFQKLSEFLTSKYMEHFMFRDFQSRNIMIKDGDAYLIDYQGGRKGPVHYDLASLLFEAKTKLPEHSRQKLLEIYLTEVSGFEKIDRQSFIDEFYWWAFVRLLQALGAFGLRGKIEKKGVFLQSIPSGLENLAYVMDRLTGGPELPELNRCLHVLIAGKDHYPSEPEIYRGLTITVTSFSYRKTYPDDISGNGGGFVYDCRFLSNPGRFEEYRSMTGFDRKVEDFFLEKGDMANFIETVKQQLNTVIEVYHKQLYDHLSVSFGCTGGRHRSVYATRILSDYLRTLDNVRVIERHRDL